MPSADGSACAVTSTHMARPVGAPQPQQVVGDRAVAREPLDERLARLRIDEPLQLERAHVLLRRFRRVAEHQLQVRIG